MENFKVDFIHFLVRTGALKFGEFDLKSGRKSPYFINTGSFYTGQQLHNLGRFYAYAFEHNKCEADVIFGPAYKGITLAAALTEALFDEFGMDLSYCFNRKEVKDHGDGGLLVGAPITEKTNVFIIDDVITAGTAIKNIVDILKQNGNPKIKGILISVNRMEKNNEGKNALEEVEKIAGAHVYSIADMDEVIEILYNKEVDGKIYIDDEKMKTIKEYRAKYGV
jgi:orotate phosphoribosyltransferase